MPFKFNPTTGALDLVNSGTVTNVTASAPLASSGGGTPNISITQSTTSTDGYLSSTDWNTFNNKVPATRNINTTSPLTGGGNLSADLTIAIPQANGSTNGYLSSADWTTFNNKQPAGNYITALTGDVTATGPGSVAATVAAIQGTTVSGTTGTTNVVFSASPALTGIPTAPTAGVGTSTTQIATTAFVLSQGFLGATGSMPFAHQSSTSVVTSATTTYVTAISTTITVTASSAPVYAKATATFTVTGAVPTVLKYRVSINAVAGQEQLLSLTAVTTNYTAAVQYISAALGPGTYNVLFEIARNSGTGTVSFFEGTLDAIALQGTSSNGITQITGLGLSVGPGSGAQTLTGTLSLAGGGTNASLVASNGGIVYSTATAFAVLAGTATARQMLQSGASAAPTWSTATWPATTTINQILYSNAANTVTGLATANTGALVTSNTGVPSITSGATANRLLRTNGTTVSFAQANLTTDVTGTLPFANGGTGATTFASGRVIFSGATALGTAGDFLFDTANTRLTVGTGGGTGTINCVPTVGASTLGLNVFSQTANHSIQVQNQAAMALEMINANAGGGGIGTGCLMRATVSRGTLTARTAAQSGDQVWRMSGLAYFNSSTTGGETNFINYVLTENYTSTNQGGEINFGTTPNGTTASVQRLKITNSGESVFSNAIATARYTTAAKNALTPVGGWVVFDTDLNQLSYYNGTTWVNL